MPVTNTATAVTGATVPATVSTSSPRPDLVLLPDTAVTAPAPTPVTVPDLVPAATASAATADRVLGLKFTDTGTGTDTEVVLGTRTLALSFLSSL